MKRWLLSTAALVLALPLAAARPAMAAEVKAIAQAVGDKDPFVLSWADTADGKVALDDEMGEIVYDLFAGAQYILTDDGQLLLGHLKGTDLTLFLPQAAQVHNEAKTYFIVHVRNKERTVFLDGRIARSTEDPTKGYAEFTLLLIDSQGESTSTHIEQELTFTNNDILSKPSG
jgi:hypothetical protein